MVKEGRDKMRREKEIVKREKIDFARRKRYGEKDEKRLYKKEEICCEKRKKDGERGGDRRKRGR